MSNARCIGRVGGLAVALGVGMAVAGSPGVALAVPSAPNPNPSADPDGTLYVTDAGDGNLYVVAPRNQAGNM